MPVHPRNLAARLARRVRFLDNFRGWRKLCNAIVPADPTLVFRVRNDGLWIAGNLESYIEREVYLFGGYERRAINAFLAVVPAGRRQVALDVGANIGTHTLRFAAEFAAVQSFEPNPRVFSRLSRNVSLNTLRHVQLHPIGLGDRSALLDFHNIGASNAGLGTFSKVEQYDQKLQVVGRAQIKRGDDYLRPHLKQRVDAVKIDVQGFEPEVLLGMQELLTRDRPYVWLEVGMPTKSAFPTLDALARFIPYPFRLLRFVNESTGLGKRLRLVPAPSPEIDFADYVVAPLSDS